MNRTLKTMNRFALVLKIEDSGSEACNPQIVTKIDRAEKFSDPYAGVIDDIALRGGAVRGGWGRRGAAHSEVARQAGT